VAFATLRAEDGRALATVALSPESEGLVLVVSRVVSGNGPLLMHYFAGGVRAVLVEEGDAVVAGTLATRWIGNRRLWLVRIASPVAAGVFEQAESGEDAAGPGVAIANPAS